MSNIKPFIDQYNWTKIDFSSEKLTGTSLK